MPILWLVEMHVNKATAFSQRLTMTKKKGQTAQNHTREKLKHRNENQLQYMQYMIEKEIVLAYGAAGTGKSHCAVGMAVEALNRKLVDKIVITRPVVEAGERLGFLPGDMESKLLPYLMPIYDELSKFAGLGEINAWKADKKLIIEPLAFMRGRTFDRTFLIADEMQNATWTQIKMVLTRIGKESRFVLNGDHEQTDLPSGQQGAFLWACENLVGIPELGVVKFDKCDIVRNPVIGKILDKFDLLKN